MAPETRREILLPSVAPGQYAYTLKIGVLALNPPVYPPDGNPQ
jgi:hypothetical protein